MKHYLCLEDIELRYDDDFDSNVENGKEIICKAGEVYEGEADLRTIYSPITGCDHTISTFDYYFEEAENSKTALYEEPDLKDKPYKVLFYQIIEAPGRPSDNGKLVAQRGSIKECNKFFLEHSDISYGLRAVCDDGHTRWVI